MVVIATVYAHHKIKISSNEQVRYVLHSGYSYLFWCKGNRSLIVLTKTEWIVHENVFNYSIMVFVTILFYCTRVSFPLWKLLNSQLQSLALMLAISFIPTDDSLALLFLSKLKLPSTLKCIILLPFIILCVLTRYILCRLIFFQVQFLHIRRQTLIISNHLRFLNINLLLFLNARGIV